MDIQSQSRGELVIVTVNGAVGPRRNGEFCDTLIRSIRSGHTDMLIEFSADASLARPCVRGLLVAACFLRGTRGRMRIVAGPEIADLVRQAGFSHLLRFAPDRAAALREFGFDESVGTTEPPHQSPVAALFAQTAAGPAPRAPLPAAAPRRPRHESEFALSAEAAFANC